MNKVQRKKLKRSANLKLLFFTFFGAFIIFFVAFTYILPVVTPQVEIPALTEDHVFNSITSHDFRGRIDPRPHSLEEQEKITPEKKQNEEKKEAPVPVRTPVDSISNEDQWHSEQQEKTTEEPFGVPLPGVNTGEEKKAKTQTAEENKQPFAGGPPRPRPLALKEKVDVAPPAPVFKAKVVVGEFSRPKEAQMTSEILTSLDYEPFIRERSGKYMLQVGSFSETEKAKSMVQELKNRNFDARVIYE